MKKNITWKSKQKFFQGSPDRLITEKESIAIWILAGATLMVLLIRTYQMIRWWI